MSPRNRICGIADHCCCSLATPLWAVDTDWIARLGGKVERDSAGRIVAVNLRGSWISDVEMIELARLPDLERLDLSHTRISDEGMLNLKPAPKIRELKLFYSEWITDQGMTAIKEWKHLKRLDLRGTRISDGTLEIVGRLTGLEALDIAHTEVTDVGLENLITLVNLKELALGRGRLSNAGLVALRMLPTLTYLDLSGARPTPPDAPAGRGGGLRHTGGDAEGDRGTERSARALPGILRHHARTAFALWARWRRSRSSDFRDAAGWTMPRWRNWPSGRA